MDRLDLLLPLGVSGSARTVSQVAGGGVRGAGKIKARNSRGRGRGRGRRGSAAGRAPDCVPHLQGCVLPPSAARCPALPRGYAEGRYAKYNSGILRNK